MSYAAAAAAENSRTAENEGRQGNSKDATEFEMNIGDEWLRSRRSAFSTPRRTVKPDVKN